MVNNDQHPGSTIVRGPMASDHYTTVHNLVARSQVIPTQYVGVFLYITSHVAGWKLTESKIGKDLGKGRAFVKSAIAAIEAAHCLIREQEQASDGLFGGSRWFVTDLPLQLRQLGVLDEDTIRAKVHEAFAEWKELVDNSPHTLRHGDARHNDEGERNPSAAPMSGNPTSVNSQRSTDVGLSDVGLSDVGSSDVGQPAPKKTNTQEDQHKKINSSSSSSSASIAGTLDPHTEQSEEEQPENSQRGDNAPGGGDADASTATATTTGHVDALLQRFWQALPPEITPNARQRGTLRDTLATSFIADEWGQDDGPELLAQWFTARIPRDGVRNIAAWIRSQTTAHLPAGPSDRERDGSMPWDNCPSGCDENSMVERADGSMERCPYNHRCGSTVSSDQAGDEIRRRAMASLAQAGQSPAGSHVADEQAPPF